MQKYQLVPDFMQIWSTLLNTWHLWPVSVKNLIYYSGKLDLNRVSICKFTRGLFLCKVCNDSRHLCTLSYGDQYCRDISKFGFMHFNVWCISYSILLLLWLPVYLRREISLIFNYYYFRRHCHHHFLRYFVFKYLKDNSSDNWYSTFF